MLQTRLHVADGRMVVQNTQDCTPIAEYAKARHNEGFHGSSEFKFAGSIPQVMIEKYCNDNHITFSEWSQNKEHIKRLLNDPAMDHFRVWKGKV